MYVCGGVCMQTDMEASFFLKVWDIYQEHWGRQEQLLIRSHVSARLLDTSFKRSDKMNSIQFMHNMLTVMWNMEFLNDKNELFSSIKDMASVCLGEEALGVDDDHYNCENVFHRQWVSLNRPIIHYMSNMDDSLYRVSALIALR